MNDEIYIDEDGRFQMPADEMDRFIAYLRENHVPCEAEDAGAFRSEGRRYGYARLNHPYDLETARDLCVTWRRGAEV